MCYRVLLFHYQKRIEEKGRASNHMTTVPINDDRQGLDASVHFRPVLGRHNLVIAVEPVEDLSMRGRTYSRNCRRAKQVGNDGRLIFNDGKRLLAIFEAAQ